MVERLPNISAPSQHSITKVNPKDIKRTEINNFETTIKSTQNIQYLQEKINAKSTLIFSWQNLANLLQNKLLSQNLSKSEAMASREMIDSLDIQIKNAKVEIEQLKAQLEAEENKASQDKITKDETQKTQVMAKNVLALKSTIEQQK